MSELFGHLHRHGEFSRLDGIGTAKQYAERAADLGQSFLAQTDHGTLSGALHHIAACRQVGILPIVGVEAYYRPNRFSKDTRQAWHLILLAKNLKGWHNLLRLVSTAYADPAEGGGFYQVPCIDEELLDKYPEGLICSSACFQSWAAQLIAGGDSVALRSYVRKMKKRFGSDFYIEIMPHDFDEQRTLNIELSRLASDESIPLLATNDAHFVYPKWAETQRIAKMMSTNLSFEKVKKLMEKGEDPPYMAELIPNLYLCSRDDMMRWFSEFHPKLDTKSWVEALHGTVDLAKSIKPFMLDTATKMPKVSTTAEDSEKLLRQWVGEGLSQIESEYPQHHWDKWNWDIYLERIEFEFSVLKKKNAISYMVMVGDIIRWCRREGIRVGVRGSAAGCLISYLIGISSLDPISWGLLFERFLNPDRKGMPDIDIDIQGNRRHEVKQYIINKYGAEHVADIITHERFQPKSVLQRVCRAFDVPYLDAKEVTDTIDIRPDDEETKLEELLPINEKLRGFKSKYPEVWTHAVRLEGSVANVGKHAAGVVITPKPIIEYMALERGKKGDLVTSWADSADFAAISDNGFIKIDLLGLQGLERHDYALRLIKERWNIDIDLDKLEPHRDPDAIEPPVMAQFTRRETIGLFQFGGKGITNLISTIDPNSCFDLCAANALYRPGPMNGGVTWDYARIKHGQKDPPKWAKSNEVVWEILSETYGLISYQEQVMIIAQRMGNFTPGQADDLRKAMGKLYRIQGEAARQFMQKFHEQWVIGCEQNGVDDKTRDQVWDFILGFGSYGFNKTMKYDSVVERFTTNQHDPNPNISLQEIWERFYGYKRSTPVGQKYRSRGLWIRGYDKDTGRITKKHVIDIHDHGRLPLFKITLENGLSVSASKQHRHMTPDGWRTVDQLRIGDELLYDTKVQDATLVSGYRPIITPPWSRGSISDSSKIVSIEFDGHHQAYDLEVEGETDMDHNYVANGIVTHNSHSGWYGFRAYQDAWLKEHYPLEFYASILTFPSGSSPQAKTEFMHSVVREAKSRKIKFLSPDVNKSDMNWTVEGDGIRVGLVAIKDVGDVAAAKIILKRPAHNPFTNTDGYTSIADIQRLCGSKVNKKVITALTESGAFDSFGARDEASLTQMAVWEKDRLKMTIRGVSESDKYAHLIRPNIFSQEEVERIDKGSEVIVGGEITKVEIKEAKNGKKFANVTVSFEMNEWRIKFWENQLLMFEEYLVVGQTIMVNGRKDEWNGFISVVVNDICDMETMAVDAELIDDGVLEATGPSGGPTELPKPKTPLGTYR